MRYLGIDYGSKRIGLAHSDEAGKFAFPHSVLEGDDPIKKIMLLVSKEKVSEIVLGESKDFKGKDNAIMKKIHEFKVELEKTTNIPVHFEPEFLTSVEAERLQGKHDKLDASAAALILQSFLDRKNQ